jgi:uncharacterized protein YndB with AHSA1/START domain
MFQKKIIMNASQIFEIEINSNPENIWDILTNPKIVPLYMYGTTPETTWKIEDPIEWTMVHNEIKTTFVNGVIKEYDKPNKLAYTVFPTLSEIKDIPKNHLLVEIIINQEASKCKLKLNISGFDEVENADKRYQDSQNGWNETLPKIKQLAEN